MSHYPDFEQAPAGELRAIIHHALSRAVRIFAISLALLSLLFAVACGSGSSSSSSSSTVTVSISPASTSLDAGQQIAFTATVSNSKNTAVIWKVNGVAGGNATYGTITASGTYFAPGTVSSTVTETITAVADADSSVSASATVTLNPSSTSTGTSLTINPPFVVLAAGSQQTFTAQTGTSSATVVWTLNCQSLVNSDCGTISTSGVYSAPLTPPPGGNVTVSATPSDGSTNTGYSSVTVQYSNATLAGQYALAFSGENGSTPIMLAGSITFDGAGHVTGGTEDSGAGSSANISGGSYHIGTDGRGTATVQTSAGTSTWQFVVVNHSTIFVTAPDSAGNGTMSGELDLQNPTQFNSAVISGNYTFVLRCPAGSAPLAQVGTILANGAGGISQGLQDVNVSGGAQSALNVTGTFTAPSASTGRGQMTLTSSYGTQNLIYYLVDATHFKLLQQGSTSPAIGDAVKQTAGPFSTAGINGKFAVVLYGLNSAEPASFGSQFRLDGLGGSAATVSGNVNGNVQTNVTSTGTYAVTNATFGRTQLSLTANGKTYQFVLYPASGEDAYMAEVDSTVAAGHAYAQQGFVITTGSLAGNFATSLSGSNLSGSTSFESVTGQTVINGGGAITATLDASLNGNVTAETSLTASYFVDPTGFVTVAYTSPASALNTGTLTLYPIDAQRFLSMEIDSNRVLTGFSEVHN